MTLGPHLRVSAIAIVATSVTSELELSVPPLTSGRGRVERGWRLSSINSCHQLCLENEAHIKPKGLGSKIFQVGEYMRIWGECCAISPYLALCIFSIWLFWSYSLL